MTDQEMGQRARDERLEVISTELRRRIRPVCADMPEEVFFDMIERMAAIQLKYELLEDPATG
jgi:CRISPR/Cas system type I-B associated protein Csh2 (Cas7 group RAMP superfamily)